MVRVYIVAATPALRAGLRAMLAGPELEVVAEGAGLGGWAAPAIDALVVAEAGLLADAARALAGDTPPALVLLAGDGQAAALLRELPLRGWAIVAPDAEGAELRAAVVAAAQGMVALPRALAAGLLAQPRPGGGADHEPLTGREREVLDLLSQGLPNKLIARQLQISEHTVKFHISSIFVKLGASSRTDAVSRGARQGLIAL